VTLVSMAFAFLRVEQARAKKNFWCDLAQDPATDAGSADSPGGTLSVVSDDFR
jgi:cell wall assembly regulator SMI1